MVELSWRGQWTTFCSLGAAEVPQSVQLWQSGEGIDWISLFFPSFFFFPLWFQLRDMCGEQYSSRAWGESWWDQDLPFPQSPSNSHPFEHPKNYHRILFFLQILFVIENNSNPLPPYLESFMWQPDSGLWGYFKSGQIENLHLNFIDCIFITQPSLQRRVNTTFQCCTIFKLHGRR